MLDAPSFVLPLVDNYLLGSKPTSEALKQLKRMEGVVSDAYGAAMLGALDSSNFSTIAHLYRVSEEILQQPFKGVLKYAVTTANERLVKWPVIFLCVPITEEALAYAAITPGCGDIAAFIKNWIELWPANVAYISRNRNATNLVFKSVDGHPNEKCTERLFTTAASLELFKWNNASVGVRTTDSIPAGTLIAEYVGGGLRPLHADPVDMRYIAVIPNYCAVIDASNMGNICRFVNRHRDLDACNCEGRVFVDKGAPRIGIYAQTAIQSGEKLVLQYSKI